MSLERLTKIDGGGISTTSDYRVGVITSSKFVGPFDGTAGNFSGIITASGANFSGNVTIGGTLTYEDVTNIDSVGIITAPAVDVDDFLDVGSNIKLGNAGVVTATTFKGDGDFVELDVDGHTNLDNVSVAGVSTFTGLIDAEGGITVDDYLELFHYSGTNFIRPNNGSLDIINPGGGPNIARFIPGNGVELWHTASKKFNTTSTGAVVTGILTVSQDLDVDGHTNLDNVSIAGVTTNTGILYANSSVRINTTDDQALRLNATDNGPIYMRFDRSGARKAWLGYGSATDSLSLRNEISDGDLYLSVTDGGSTKSAIHIDSSENAKVNIPQDLDVDGHTNLDNVSIAGVTTFYTSPVVPNGGYYKGIINSGSQQKIVGGYISGTDTLRLGESMYLTSTGLGIGDNDPDYMLQLKGTIPAIALEDTSGTHGFSVIEQNDDNLKIRCDAGNQSSGYNSNIRFEIDGTEKVRIKSNGYVGIGTDNPSQPLTLARSSAGQSEFGLRFQYVNQTGPTQTSSALLVGSYGLKLKNYNSNRNFLFETGNVGIGTDNPSAQSSSANNLVVADFGGEGGITIKSNVSSAGNIFFADTAGAATGRIAYGHGATDAGDYLRFYVNSEERVRIDSAGRLLVKQGTASDPASETTILAQGNSASASSYSVVDLRRGSAATSDGNVLGYIRFSDTNINSSNRNYAWIAGMADGTSSSGTDNPGRLVFATCPDDSTGLQESLRITSSGHISMRRSVLPLSGTGNVFSFNLYRDSGVGYGYIDAVTSGGNTAGIKIRGYSNTVYTNAFDHYAGVTKLAAGTIADRITLGSREITIKTASYPETTEYLAVFNAGVANGNRFKNRYIKIRNNYTGSVHGGVPIVWESNADGSNNKAYGAIVTEGNGDIRFLNAAATSEKAIGTDLLGTISEKFRITNSGNVKLGTVGSALNFTDSNSGNTKYIEVGATSGGDALFVTHSSGYGVGYFGYEAGGDRLVIACDGGGGNNRIDFITDAGTSTGGGTDNLNGKSPKMRITAGGIVQIGGSTHDGADLDSSNTKLTIKQSANSMEDGLYIERSGERKGYYMRINPSPGAGDALTFARNNNGTKADVMALDRDGTVIITDGNLEGYNGYKYCYPGNYRTASNKARFMARVNYASGVYWPGDNGTPVTALSAANDTNTGGNFGSNGGSSENNLGYADHNGLVTCAAVWRAQNNDSDSGPDGGWNKGINGLPGDDWGYMVTCHVRRVGSNTSGSFYYGCSGSHTLNQNGNANPNPYFFSFGISTLPANIWCLAVGIITPNGAGQQSNPTTGSLNGMWRLDDGSKLTSGNMYRMKDGSTSQVHRTYLFYSTQSAAHLQWRQPGFYVMDGSEPSISELSHGRLCFKSGTGIVAVEDA